MSFRWIIVFSLAIVLFPLLARAGRWDGEADPLALARAAADRELFGRILAEDARPEAKVRHGRDWQDATLMSGVAALSDRLDETGRPAPRYPDYLEAWGGRRPDSLFTPIHHGDRVCAGYTYLWLYERSGRTSPHLAWTDGMVRFLFHDRLLTQLGTGYESNWMRFWNDDLHMVPPFLARRGRIAQGDGIPDGKDGRVLAMEYLRAYADILQDPATGLYWHDQFSVGKYMWGRGNGWAAAGMVKVHEELARGGDYDADAAWIREQLVKMAATLKQNRNPVGTWNADVRNRKDYTAPETSGSAFFVYMLAYMVNRGYLPADEYLPVIQKAWHFLALSMMDDGSLMRVQPVGRGPIKADFELNSESYGVGAFLLAAVEVSKLAPAALAQINRVECLEIPISDNASPPKRLELEIAQFPGLPANPGGRVQAVMAGRRLLPTRGEKDAIIIDGIEPGPEGKVFLFYQP
jgi:rhamnogalacturonyl hydrolase YesR